MCMLLKRLVTYPFMLQQASRFHANLLCGLR